MKKLSTFLFAAALLVTTGACNKIKDLATITFTVGYDGSASFSNVPGLPNTDSMLPLPTPQAADLPSLNIPTNNENVFSAQNTAADKLISAKLSKLTLSITQPAGGNMNFLNKISIYMSAPGISEVLVAQKDPVPKGSGSIDLDVQGTELKPLLQADSIKVRVATVLNSVPPSNTTLGIRSEFKVTANPLQ